MQLMSEMTGETQSCGNGSNITSFLWSSVAVLCTAAPDIPTGSGWGGDFM